MATSTSIPQTASFPFYHFDPLSLKRIRSKSKAKVTGHTLRKDRREGATPPSGSLHQGSEDDLCAVPPQTLQAQATGHINDVEEMDSEMCDLFGAVHGTSMYDLTSGDGHYQSGRELLDKGGLDHDTCIATPDLSTNESLDGSSQDFYSIGESGVAEEHHSATHFEPSNGASDY